MNNWSSKQYLKFGNERTQPSQDLISRLKINPKSILDIGCGPGNSTNALAERFCDAHITGIDSSQNMLDSAIAAYPKLDFRKCCVPDELDCIDGKFDLIFSNACIQWIPNHDRLLSALDETERDEFLAVLRKRIEHQYPIRRNGKVILKMPRLFFTALK